MCVFYLNINGGGGIELFPLSHKYTHIPMYTDTPIPIPIPICNNT